MGVSLMERHGSRQTRSRLPWALLTIFALVRPEHGIVRLLSAHPIMLEESFEWLMLLGLLDVRRVSGDRIASVCRLCACAPNYLPPILLSCFTSEFTLVDHV